MTAPARWKVLILDGHSKAAAASLLALPGDCRLHVAATDDDCLCFASPRVRVRWRQPETPADLRAWLCDLYARERYDLVIASTEASLLAVKSQDLAAELRARCVLAPERSLDAALDKRRTLELATGLHVPVPPGMLVTSLDAAVEPTAWPTVVKPIRSKVVTAQHTLSLTPHICANADDWHAALAALLPWSPVLVQDYVPGFGVGVEALFEHGEPRWLFAHRRVHEWPVTGGASTYRRAIAVPPVLRRAALDLLGALDWHGVAMVEFKLADDGAYNLMEINPRLWGSVPLAIAAGVNFPLGLLRIATGLPVGPQPAYRLLHARDVVKDVHWFEDSWRNRGNPLRLAPLRLRDYAGWLRPLIGREHWDLFRWREPGLWWASTRPAVVGLLARLHRAAGLRRTRANWRRLGPAWRDGRIRRVLVLGSQDACRAPLVATLLRRALPDLAIDSAGVHARTDPAPPADWADAARQVLGFDLPHRPPQPVDAAAIAAADLVLVMDIPGWRALATNHPAALRRAILIAATAMVDGPPEVRDPRDDDDAGMRVTVRQLARSCASLAAQRTRSIAGTDASTIKPA